MFSRLVLPGWSSSGDLEEDGARRGESHHPGQSWEEGGQPGPRRPRAAGEERPPGAQREPHRAPDTSQRGPSKAPRRWATCSEREALFPSCFLHGVPSFEGFGCHLVAPSSSAEFSGLLRMHTSYYFSPESDSWALGWCWLSISSV